MNSYNMKDFQNAIVWSYSRVSSKEQFERNSSIETQVRAIQDFASEHHLLITISPNINSKRLDDKLYQTILCFLKARMPNNDVPITTAKNR